MTRRGPGRPPYPDILTPAEWRILDEVRTGATNAEIAIRLGISPYTVKYHVSNILGKLELRNRRQIATWSPQPERVRFREMVGARLRALVAPLAAPLAFLSKPLVGWGVAAAVTLVAIPAVVLAILLTRPGEPVNVLISPAPAGSPAAGVTATPEPTPTASPTPDPTPPPTPTPAPQPTPTPEPSPTPEPEPEPTPTPEPTPEPEPTAEATPNALGIREIATDEAFTRLKYAPGELIAEDSGLFLLDVETGSVEGWQGFGLDGFWIAISPDGRYVASQGALHDREANRTFAWESTALRRAAWSDGDGIAFERLSGDTEGGVARYVVVGPSMEPEAEFEVASGRQVEAWRLESGVLLASSGQQLHLVQVANGDDVAFDNPGGVVHVFPAGEGFAFTVVPGAEGAASVNCRVVRYDWTARLLSDVSFGCAGFPGVIGAGVQLSPDGRWIAAVTRVLRQDPGPGNTPVLTALSILDAETGEEVFRVRGAAFPTVLPEGATPWLADGSRLLVGTVAGVQVVSVEGRWVLSSPMLSSAAWVLPAPDDPSRIALDVVKVTNLEGDLLAVANFDSSVSWSAWGRTSRELRIEAVPISSAWFGVVPVILPAIQLLPFDDSLTAEVVVDSCLNVRAEPTTESEIVVCLPPERVVELISHPSSGYLVEGPCFEEDAGPCVWVYVLTEDDEQGWAYSGFLRWPGTPLAVTEEEPVSGEAAEG